MRKRLENNQELQASLFPLYEIMRSTIDPARDIPDEHIKVLEKLGLVKYGHWDDGEEHSIGAMMMIGAGTVSGYITTELGDKVCELLKSNPKNPYLERWLQFAKQKKINIKARITLYEKLRNGFLKNGWEATIASRYAKRNLKRKKRNH